MIEVVVNTVLGEVVTLDSLQHAEWTLRKLALEDPRVWGVLADSCEDSVVVDGTWYGWSHVIYSQWLWVSQSHDGFRRFGFDTLEVIQGWLPQEGEDE